MFEAALAENPADLTVLEALREIYTRLGDIERLMETAERIERFDPDQGALGGGPAPVLDPTPAAPIVPPAPPPAAPPPALPPPPTPTPTPPTAARTPPTAPTSSLP